jgi:uncharacterized protein YidB (DUF937 family)
MFENLLQLVKDNAGDAIVNNPAIPNEHNDAAISTAAGGIMDQLKGLASSGNLSQITSLFGQGNDVSSNPVVSNISSSVAGNLMSKFGINSDQANGVVQSLIPTVMNKLVSKTNDPSDNSFDLQGIMGSLSSGSMDGIMGGIKNMFG